MKKTNILLAFAFAISMSCFAQDKKDGFYKTYDDYLNGNVKHEGNFDYVGTTSITFEKEEKKKKYKIKESPYWGCIEYDEYGSNEVFRFVNGRAYKILLLGPISLYGEGPIWLTKNKDGTIKKVNMITGGGIKLYFHKGIDGIPKRMMNQGAIGKLLKNDKVVYEAYNKGKSPGSVKIFANVITHVELYNMRNK